MVLVGKGEDEPMLHALIAQHGLQNHVVLLGYHANVAPLLHATDVYVHTATRENCPYVLIEATASGCPALALAAGGSPELLAGTPEASLPQTTPPATTAARLAELLATPAALRDLQQRQYAYAHQRFDVATMLRHTLAFYQQAIGLSATLPQPSAASTAPTTSQPA